MSDKTQGREVKAPRWQSTAIVVLCVALYFTVAGLGFVADQRDELRIHVRKAAEREAFARQLLDECRHRSHP